MPFWHFNSIFLNSNNVVYENTIFPYIPNFVFLSRDFVFVMVQVTTTTMNEQHVENNFLVSLGHITWISVKKLRLNFLTISKFTPYFVHWLCKSYTLIFLHIWHNIWSSLINSIWGAEHCSIRQKNIIPKLYFGFKECFREQFNFYFSNHHLTISPLYIYYFLTWNYQYSWNIQSPNIRTHTFKQCKLYMFGTMIQWPSHHPQTCGVIKLSWYVIICVDATTEDDDIVNGTLSRLNKVPNVISFIWIFSFFSCCLKAK